ncbi:hypothetical protein GCM10022393_09780 [Aquimarina addita]|uniref:Uncharacterized protein n=1 Tax=Aquimarina addita TaxID=870485 RepID=A0ABP7XCU0_9FLAO
MRDDSKYLRQHLGHIILVLLTAAIFIQPIFDFSLDSQSEVEYYDTEGENDISENLENDLQNIELHPVSPLFLYIGNYYKRASFFDRDINYKGFRRKNHIPPPEHSCSFYV